MIMNAIQYCVFITLMLLPAGMPVSALGSIAVMNDSDNTGESSVSYMEYIEIFR